MAPLASHARTVFSIAFVAAQIALIATAGRRPDGAFGFRMFNESSTIHVSLSRVAVAYAPSGAAGPATRTAVADGAWRARDARGVTRAIAWSDRVKRPELSAFDVEMSASYGAAAQVARWEAALDDVASHLEHDGETRQLILDITIRKNGGDPRTITLARDVRRAGEIVKPLRGGG